MVGRSGAPDAPSRPGDQGVERGPDDWEDFIGRSEVRFIEVAIPGVTISSAAVAGAIPGCTGGGEAEAGEGEQRGDGLIDLAIVSFGAGIIRGVVCARGLVLRIAVFSFTTERWAGVAGQTRSRDRSSGRYGAACE